MIPKRVHWVWLGETTTPVKNIAAMMELSRDWQYFLWTERKLSDLGLEPHYYEHSTLAGASNIIRLHAILKYGGIYMDCDIEPLKPLDALIEHEAFAVQQADGPLCNCFFGATPNHPWVQWQIDHYGDQRLHDAAHGCHVMTQAPRDGVTVLPTETAFPWNWNEPEDRSRITDKTLVVHTWEKSWLHS